MLISGLDINFSGCHRYHYWAIEIPVPLYTDILKMDDRSECTGCPNFGTQNQEGFDKLTTFNIKPLLYYKTLEIIYTGDFDEFKNPFQSGDNATRTTCIFLLIRGHFHHTPPDRLIRELELISLDKMVAINRRRFHMYFQERKVLCFDSISMKLVSDGPIDSKSVLAQVMAWRRTGDKPLSEPMLTQFTVRHWGRFTSLFRENDNICLLWQYMSIVTIYVYIVLTTSCAISYDTVLNWYCFW